MSNLSRAYCAYFGDATEVWKRYVIGEITVAFDEYRDSVCQTLQNAAILGANASTGGGQDIANQEEMFGVVLENAQQQAEQRIVNAMNQTLNHPPPVLPFPVVSILANQTVHVYPPDVSAISQGGINSSQKDGDDDSLDVSIKSEDTDTEEVQVKDEPNEEVQVKEEPNDSLDVSIKSEDTDDEEVQVKEEPNKEEEDITGRSEEQTENDNHNSNDDCETNGSQKDNSNKAANEPESEAMIINEEKANLEEDSNGPIIFAGLYSPPSASHSNAEQSIHLSEFNSRSNPDNQINNDEDIASDNENDHVDAEDGGDGDLEDDNEHVDNMEIEENYLYVIDYDDQESDSEGAMIDEENVGEESDHLEEQVNMNDEVSTDHTTDDEDAEDELAAGPSTSTGRRSTRQVSKRQIVPNRQSKGQIRTKKTEPLSVITLKLKCTVPGCKKLVKSKKAINGHLLTSHKLKHYRCLVRRCYGKVSTSFTTKTQLSDHLDQVHGRTTRLACHCSKKFKSYQELCSHYWWYHELGHFACSMDGCTFKPTRTRDKVLNHQFHHFEAKYECPVDGCDRSFKKKSHLDRHTPTHTGARPFVCTECDSSFIEKYKLTAHHRIHRNDKCYRCTWPQCTYSSTERGNVLRHIRMVHFLLPRSKTQQTEEDTIDDRDPRDFLAKD